MGHMNVVRLTTQIWWSPQAPEANSNMSPISLEFSVKKSPSFHYGRAAAAAAAAAPTYE